jgi:UDP-N-acetylglucosamine 2-epimerase (non-hydrolysing)
MAAAQDTPRYLPRADAAPGTERAMTVPSRIMVVAGARPNFMKIAPILHEVRARVLQGNTDLACELVHTGQHYDPAMSGVFFRELDIPAPDVNLGVGSGTHAGQTAAVMTAFEPVCLARRPDWVVVVGDVNSTLACTLVCAKLGIRVAHVEAGLRSFDRSMPEEINRIVTDALADLLLTPSVDADANLAREGIEPGRIRRVGNVMIDALVANRERARRADIPFVLRLSPRRFVYVTLHRPSNVDDRPQLERVVEELVAISRHLPVVFPIHPRTRKMIEAFGLRIPPEARVHLVDPVGYHDSLWLVENARFVLTDSGGIQEETTFLGTPCLTLRPNTERPVTVTVGTNRLTGLDRLQRDVDRILRDEHPRGTIPEYWDGRTAKRIVDALLEEYR